MFGVCLRQGKRVTGISEAVATFPESQLHFVREAGELRTVHGRRR